MGGCGGITCALHSFSLGYPTTSLIIFSDFFLATKTSSVSFESCMIQDKYLISHDTSVKPKV